MNMHANEVKTISTWCTTSVSVLPTTTCVTINNNAWPITTWAPYSLPSPSLDAICCPGCGNGNVKKTDIEGIVECAYCGRQFTLRYNHA